MRIGIDIDDTMTDILEDFKKEAIKYDIKLGNSGNFLYKSYNIENRFDWNDKEKSFFRENIARKIVNNAHLRFGLRDVIDKLKEDGHEIIVITARSEYEYKNCYDMCKKWLKKENIYYDKLITEAIDKRFVCKIEKIDIFIDDNVKNVSMVNELGIKTLIMDNVENTLNNPDIERVYDFYEFYNSVNKYIQNLK